MKNNVIRDECQTQSWFQSVLWDCFGGTNFQHGGKFVPQNSPRVGFILGLLGLMCQAIHSEI